MIKITTIVNDAIRYNETVAAPRQKNLNTWVVRVYEGHIDNITPKNRAVDISFTTEIKANIFYTDITTPCARTSGNINFQRIVYNQ